MDLISGYSSSSDDDVSAVTISALPTRRNSTSNAFVHLMARAKSTKNMLTSNVEANSNKRPQTAENRDQNFEVDFEDLPESLPKFLRWI